MDLGWLEEVIAKNHAVATPHWYTEKAEGKQIWLAQIGMNGDPKLYSSVLQNQFDSSFIRINQEVDEECLPAEVEVANRHLEGRLFINARKPRKESWQLLTEALFPKGYLKDSHRFSKCKKLQVDMPGTVLSYHRETDDVWTTNTERYLPAFRSIATVEFATKAPVQYVLDILEALYETAGTRVALYADAKHDSGVFDPVSV